MATIINERDKILQAATTRLIRTSVGIVASAQAFVSQSNTGTISPSTITLVATPIDFTVPVYTWYYVIGGTPTVISGANTNTLVLTSEDFTTHRGSNTAVGYKVVVSQTGRTSSEYTYTINYIRNGDDAYSFISDPAIVNLIANASGVINAGQLPATGEILIYRGASEVTSGVTYSVDTTTNCVASVNATSGVFSITSVTASTAQVVFKAIIVSGSNVVTLYKTLPVAVVNYGANGSNGSRGSVIRYATSVTLWSGGYSDTTYNTLFPSPMTIGDTLTVSTSGVGATTRYWDGTGWADPAQVINGNLLVIGTVFADKVRVNGTSGIELNSAGSTVGYIKMATTYAGGSANAILLENTNTSGGYGISMAAKNSAGTSFAEFYMPPGSFNNCNYVFRTPSAGGGVTIQTTQADLQILSVGGALTLNSGLGFSPINFVSSNLYSDATGISISGSTYATIAMRDAAWSTSNYWFHVMDDGLYTMRYGGSSPGASSTKLTINTSGDLTASGNVTAYSDKRIKTDIVQLKDVQKKIQNIHGYTYHNILTKRNDIGVLAQELELEYPELVHLVDNIKTVSYNGLIPILLEYTKELHNRIERLERRLDALTE